jgi:hypothetical protein
MSSVEGLDISDTELQVAQTSIYTRIYLNPVSAKRRKFRSLQQQKIVALGSI